MNSCDACGLKYTAKTYSGHNCFDTIKQVGRSELAGDLLTKIDLDGLSDAAAMRYVRAVLVTEQKAMPEIEPQRAVGITDGVPARESASGTA